MFQKAAFGLVFGLGITLACMSPGKTVQAQEKAALDCAIQWLPDTTSAFSIHLRNKEQVDAILKSKALKKLKEMPFAKILKGKIQEVWDAQKEKDATFDTKIGMAKKALEVLINLGSEEVAIATGPNTPESFRFMQKLSNTLQMAPLAELLQGNLAAFETFEGLQIEALVKAIAQSPEKLKIPDLLVAFRLKDKKFVEETLPKIEEQLPILGLFNPKLAGIGKKEKIGGGEFITLRLNGAMLPLDGLEIPNLDDKAKKTVVAAIKKLTLVAGVGLRGDYLVFYIGPDDKFLASLGKGKSIAASKDLSPLAKHANSKVTMLQYSSKKLMELFRGNPDDTKEMFDSIKGMLNKAELPKELGDKVRKDVSEFLEEASRFIPKAGHDLTVASMNDKGYEFVNYNYSASPGLDGSKPLGILQQLGGSPILAFTCRGSAIEGEKQIRFISKWVGVGYGYGKEFGLPNLPPDQRDFIDPLLKQVEPLFKEFSRNTLEGLIPSLKDSQIAFVLDGKLASKKWGPEMPKSKVDLPILEPAIVLGVSDAAMLRKSMESYRETLDRLIQAFAGLDPTGSLAQIRIPTPEVTVKGANRIYHYPIPQLAEVDPRLIPCVALGGKALAVAISFEHAERLLKPTPLSTGALKDIDLEKNLGCVFFFDEQAFIKFLTPWTEYALDNHVPAAVEAQFKIRSQVKEVLTLFGVCKGMVGYSYPEGGAWVTRVLSNWQDLD
ncbi:MAG: hypothetical protein EXR99_09230 [Gemmataceae bacterium]|nr:hypothetical protein [Gemmataceae bacterium]